MPPEAEKLTIWFSRALCELGEQESNPLVGGDTGGVPPPPEQAPNEHVWPAGQAKGADQQY
ncbi:MAG: hypothetical protein Q7J73_08160 [Dehalococcoidales bacterium]|nr:hypothetical protein [Dehalococcoidales bacterium]